MAGHNAKFETGILGDLPALNASVARAPDRRQVSLRWLSGTVLVGLTSVFLMGGALYAALEGRQQLALPAQAYERAAGSQRLGDEIAKGDRPGMNFSIDASNSDVMMVSTVSREGDRDVVKVKPFLHIDTPLAVAPKSDFDYPPFDPMAIFADTGSPEPAAGSNDLIYGADVESEVSIKQVDFDPDDPLLSKTPRQRTSDIEELVLNAAPNLDAGTNSIAALSYFDPGRFSLRNNVLVNPTDVTVTAENITVMDKAPGGPDYDGVRYEERVIRVREQTPVSKLFQDQGVNKPEADLLEKVFSSDLGATSLQADDRLRLSLEIDPKGDGSPHVRLASVYRNATHLVSIARTDNNRYVYATEPAPIPQVTSTSDLPPPAVGHLPTVYDAIYRASLSEGLSTRLVQRLIRIFSSSVDFNSTISPNDELSAFVSLDDNKKKPSDTAEILYASIKLGSVTRKYYRFRDSKSGTVDYFDEDGKSVKKFLLRQPVPGARFTSPFGMRYHPILKIRRMHWGVDWAAPRGTPILAAGDGVIEHAGWHRGAGRQTVIRHANGYETVYDHQSGIAKGVAPGAHVRQGQVIGYVGSTGLSTGPHLHYEVHVNGTIVNPMRIRLPKGKVLEGQDLVAFKAERERIDDLLAEDKPTDVAAEF